MPLVLTQLDDGAKPGKNSANIDGHLLGADRRTLPRPVDKAKLVKNLTGGT